MSHSIIDKDPKGKVFDARAKDGKSREIDGQSRFCGHRFILQGKLFGDKRCMYCGKWFHWKQSDSDKWIKDNNLDDTNVENIIEPLHCGSTHCSNYHVEFERSMERRTMELFNRLRSKGLI